MGAAILTRLLQVKRLRAFVVAGGLKIVYDLLSLAMFRSVKPPEEQ